MQCALPLKVPYLVIVCCFLIDFVVRQALNKVFHGSGSVQHVLPLMVIYPCPGDLFCNQVKGINAQAWSRSLKCDLTQPPPCTPVLAAVAPALFDASDLKSDPTQPLLLCCVALHSCPGYLPRPFLASVKCHAAHMSQLNPCCCAVPPCAAVLAD